MPSKPQLALYAALAFAFVLIGARFLCEGGGSSGAAGGAGAFATGAPSARTTSTAALGAAAGAADAASSGAAGAAAGGLLVVDVEGAVRRPGVYRLSAGARTIDAVRRAGGLTHRADRLAVNLAARVVDGGEVVVPAAGGPGGAAASAGASASAGRSGAGGAVKGPLSIDLNTATEQQLEQLDGVGPATAAKIVAWRDQHGGISSVDQLDAVPGIGPAKLAAIRAQLGR
jgi:competence protein ComEA